MNAIVCDRCGKIFRKHSAEMGRTYWIKEQDRKYEIEIDCIYTWKGFFASRRVAHLCQKCLPELMSLAASEDGE